MKRLLLFLFIAILIWTGTVIYALRGPNDYGDTKNRDAMFEYRKIDHEGDDPFNYEWVSQTGSDSDGQVSTSSSVDAEQAYGLPFYTWAYSSFGCNNNSIGEYQASASVLNFGTHLGLTLKRMIDFPDTSFAIGKYSGAFSKTVSMGIEWEEQTDPLIINDYVLRYGSSTSVITVKDNVGEEANTLHKAESEAPVKHPDVYEW